MINNGFLVSRLSNAARNLKWKKYALVVPKMQKSENISVSQTWISRVSKFLCSLQYLFRCKNVGCILQFQITRHTNCAYPPDSRQYNNYLLEKQLQILRKSKIFS